MGYSIKNWEVMSSFVKVFIGAIFSLIIVVMHSSNYFTMIKEHSIFNSRIVLED